MEKQLACWIYYEDGSNYYCITCVDDRLDEINSNKEFSEDINYESGDKCGFYEDYANEDYQVSCCKYGQELYSNADL